VSHEKLWRDDEVYDIVVVLGFNDNPVVPGKGSAIFMHIARQGYSPTAGCIAFSREDLLEILKNCDKTTLVCVKE
jgi:L,D-peptidoglycan transpeptidase YkuD (ErfK/YbiS/YcfS/YnhG family)